MLLSNPRKKTFLYLTLQGDVEQSLVAMRGVRAVVESKWQAEGRGARVRRSIGRPELRNLDPFLMLDEFEGSRREGAGFPDHPHRQVACLGKPVCTKMDDLFGKFPNSL